MIQALKRRFVKYITKIYDPLLNLQIGNQSIKTPLSHQLRFNVSNYPDYNFNLPRIVKYVEEFQKDISIIDIGANIGDTVAFIRNHSQAPILCIDGEKKYIDILKKNVAQYPNVKVCHALVGKETSDSNLSMKMERGTAYVTEGAGNMRMRTLDNILGDFADFANSKILKVDTDGYDTLILRGCSDFLTRAKPILFFEFDPYFISKNSDNAFDFIEYLRACGYGYLIFYMNNGDYLLGCNISDKAIIQQLIHYFSGRNIDVFADICAFFPEDRPIFERCVTAEIDHFKKSRDY